MGEGQIFEEDGTPLTPTHAVKSGRRYRYYVSRPLITGNKGGDDRSEMKGWRLPAGEIERLVGNSVKGVVVEPSTLASAAREAGLAADNVQDLLTSAERYEGDGFELVARVVLWDGELALQLDLSVMAGTNSLMIEHRVPLRIRKRGVEMKLVIENGRSGKAVTPDPSLIKVITRAYRWMEILRSGQQTSQAAIADVEGVSRRYVGQLLPLAFLAPDIVEAILAGSQPVDLTAEKLVKRVELPLEWAEQRRVLGFPGAS